MLSRALGRLLTEADHAANTSPALVLSYGAWATFLGNDPTVVGRELRTARAGYTVVGVAQRGFDGTIENDVVEFFVPMIPQISQITARGPRRRPTAGGCASREAARCSSRSRMQMTAPGRSSRVTDRAWRLGFQSVQSV
jgi:hypothetical protein